MRINKKRIALPRRIGTPAQYLFVGLGNPGEQYYETRHNVGQMAVERIASHLGIELKKSLGQSKSGHVRKHDLLLACATTGTYMNESGVAVAALVRRYGIEDICRLVIIHDELDLSPGRIQVKSGGGLAGHNGLKSIKAHLKSDEFLRIRIGIGRPNDERFPTANYVLSAARGDDREAILCAINNCIGAADTIALEGAVAAMNRFNSVVE